MARVQTHPGFGSFPGGRFAAAIEPGSMSVPGSRGVHPIKGIHPPPRATAQFAWPYPGQFPWASIVCGAGPFPAAAAQVRCAGEALYAHKFALAWANLARAARSAMACTDSPLTLSLPHRVKGKVHGPFWAALDPVWFLRHQRGVGQFPSPCSFHVVGLCLCSGGLYLAYPYALAPSPGR